ncbi:MAG TPA: trimeric intracellular cation channel family protein [Spirochaetota bacterium]|jgi:uncharacterized membrane protein YeiH|nr:MAG: hypothetical protein BWX91_01267 [Spirochaetes bacterium ADurb.Bin133]HNZ27798.1 trimeric intracellular cation channel family protein [Spirochaetota bacterium]HOF01524.1 trimeric intracellular cation channel family protein [Spirochaetota bacterium]HOS33132.1 trimeric intracellular cation channel family protein [Spirochaetota bacterium]HOS56187.1 trimeric intracellular cation channel family protein [Spirochaetota bacterium]
MEITTGINAIFILELIGAVAFAMSGATVAIREKMDLLGICILGITTAVGGGIVRDIILGITPPTAFQKPVYATTALIASLLTFLLVIRKKINIEGWFFWIMDSIGLAVFTISGALVGVSYGNAFLIVFVGNITGVGGGVIRDLFANRKPVIFQKDIYATASLIGAIIFVLLLKFNQYAAAIIGGIAVFVLRILAIKFEWGLPKVE